MSLEGYILQQQRNAAIEQRKAHASHTEPVAGCPECIRAAEKRIDEAYEGLYRNSIAYLGALEKAVEEWRKVRGKE